MLVICPWCERSGVHVTKKGLIEHPGSDLDTGAPPCVGSGQRVAIGAFGRIVKQSEARNEQAQAQPGSLPQEATAGEPATGTETGTSSDDTTDTETSPASSPVCADREADAPV